MKPKTSNSGAFNNNPANLARGEKYRFKTVYPSLVSGTVIGELVVVGVERRVYVPQFVSASHAFQNDIAICIYHLRSLAIKDSFSAFSTIDNVR